MPGAETAVREEAWKLRARETAQSAGAASRARALQRWRAAAASAFPSLSVQTNANLGGKTPNATLGARRATTPAMNFADVVALASAAGRAQQRSREFPCLSARTHAHAHAHAHPLVACVGRRSVGLVFVQERSPPSKASPEQRRPPRWGADAQRLRRENLLLFGKCGVAPRSAECDSRRPSTRTRRTEVKVRVWRVEAREKRDRRFKKTLCADRPSFLLEDRNPRSAHTLRVVSQAAAGSRSLWCTTSGSKCADMHFFQQWGGSCSAVISTGLRPPPFATGGAVQTGVYEHSTTFHASDMGETESLGTGREESAIQTRRSVYPLATSSTHRRRAHKTHINQH